MSLGGPATTRKIPVIDLAAEYRSLEKEIQAAITGVLESGAFVLGPNGAAFEKELAAYCKTRHAVGLNSGTDAILIALRALNVGPGDEVIVPSMTFFATAEPAVLLGARPVIVDIDAKTYQIDPQGVAAVITDKTKAIIAVHLYGHPAPMDELLSIARPKNIPVIEDMAQALGGRIGNRSVGGMGTIACLSFFPTKNLGAYGDAGAIVTDSEHLANRVRSLRNHGAPVKYHHEEVAYNSRLDEIQAAVLRVKLPHLDRWNDQRIAYAALYDRLLAGLPVVTPQTGAGVHPIYHVYALRTSQRDALKAFLEQKGISVGVHYPIPLHLQPAFSSLGYRPGSLPQSESLSKEVLALPIYAQLSEDDIRYVADQIRAFFKGKSG